MNRKYVSFFFFAFLTIIGWNVFLIQRDEKLYDSYYQIKVVEYSNQTK